jgi:hypothetical protein
VRPPGRLVLRRQQAAERLGEIVAYVLQLLALDAEGGAGAEVDDAEMRARGAGAAV